MSQLLLKKIVEMEIVNHFRSTRKKSYIQQPQYDTELGFWRAVSQSYMTNNAIEETETAIIKGLRDKKRAGFEARVKRVEQDYATIRAQNTPYACFEKLSKMSNDIRRRYSLIFPDSSITEQVRTTLQMEHEAYLKNIHYLPPEQHTSQPRLVNTPDKLQEIIDWRESATPKTSVDEVLAILEPFDELVVRLCYGLGEPAMSTANIGMEVGGKSKQIVSGNRVAIIKQRILNSLFHKIIPSYIQDNGADQILVIFIHFLRSDNAVNAYSTQTYKTTQGLELPINGVARRRSSQIAVVMPAGLTNKGVATDLFDCEPTPIRDLLSPVIAQLAQLRS